MEMTPTDIQQRRFKLRFRGFDVREVDAFLEQLAESFQALENENKQLKAELAGAKDQCSAYLKREETVKQTLENTEKALQQMNDNARKSAEVIVSTAEVKAEKILNRAHNRLAQLNDDIYELKRQRMQIESQIRSVIETHTKLLDMSNSEMMAMDEEFDKVKIFKQTT